MAAELVDLVHFPNPNVKLKKISWKTFLTFFEKIFLLFWDEI